MSFRILTPLSTNRMSRLIFITLLSVLILTPQSIQAARRSRLDLAAASDLVNANASDSAASLSSSSSSANNNDSESVKTAQTSALQDSLDNVLALALKTDQSSAAVSATLAEGSSLGQDNAAVPAVVDTGKSSATDLSAEDDKQPADSESVKEQKETPTASFEDAEVVESATELAASSSGSHQHEECDTDMLGFEIATG